MGNLITAFAAQWEAAYATSRFPLPAPQGADYGAAMQIVMFGVFAIVFVLILIGPERRGISFSEKEAA